MEEDDGGDEGVANHFLVDSYQSKALTLFSLGRRDLFHFAFTNFAKGITSTFLSSAYVLSPGYKT